MKRFFLLLAAWCCLGLSAALAYNPYAPNQFDAVDRNTWEYKAVYDLSKAGLTGVPMTRFAPSYNLTRYEVTEMIAAAMKNRSKATADQQREIDKLAQGYEEITHSKACICGDEFYRVQGDCNKLLSRGEHDDLVARKALIEERFPGQFNILFSTPTFLEIMPSGVDKGKGIHRLGELYGITADEIMALGDSQNDLDMLKAAGFPVAMANAVDEVKAVASYVTASNNDDGVAAAVEKFVL